MIDLQYESCPGRCQEQYAPFQERHMSVIQGKIDTCNSNRTRNDTEYKCSMIYIISTNQQKIETISSCIGFECIYSIISIDISRVFQENTGITRNFLAVQSVSKLLLSSSLLCLVVCVVCAASLIACVCACVSKKQRRSSTLRICVCCELTVCDYSEYSCKSQKRRTRMHLEIFL